MSKTLQGRGNAALFSGLEMNIRSTVNGQSGNSASRQRKVAQCDRRGKKKITAASGFIDGVVGGERVLVYAPTKRARPEREKGIEIRIRVALASMGVMVMKHHVDNRGHKRTGLGLGVADLICIVPPLGRFVAIEVKRPGYSPSDVRPDQTRWLAIVKRFGAISGIATSVEEALAIVELART